MVKPENVVLVAFHVVIAHYLLAQISIKKGFGMQVDSICFVALSAYPLISGSEEAMVGGAEVQQYLLAKEFLKKNIDVKFVTFDHGQHSVEEIAGIEVIKSCKPQNNVFGKVLGARKIRSAMQRADADLYYQRGAEMTTVLVQKFSKKNNRKFVHSISHDRETDSLQGSGTRQKIIKKTIESANLVISQNRYQYNTMKTMNIDSRIIKNGIVIRPPFPRGSKNVQNILWISTIREWKRPEIFMDIVRSMPEHFFVMAGGPDSSRGMKGKKYYEKIRKEAETIENLDFKGFVPYAQSRKLFSEAMLFVNTSDKEGFPNTFLQAWAAGIPVISLNVDPSNVIMNNNLGRSARGNSGLLASTIKEYLNNSETRERHGNNARHYITKEHDIGKIANEYLQLFADI